MGPSESLINGRMVTLKPAGDFCTVKLKLPRLCGSTNSTSFLLGKVNLISGGISGKTIELIWVPGNGTFETSRVLFSPTRYGFLSGSNRNSSLHEDKSS